MGISHEMRYVLKARLSRIVARRARMPTNTGAKPPPGPARPPPPVVDRENCPPPTGVRGGAGCGVPSEGCSWVPSVELVEELTGEPPVRDPKTSAATLAAEVAALWTVLAALAAVVPRLDGRRNAPPTEAGTVCTGAEGVKPAAGLASAGVGRRLPSPRGAAGEAAGKAAGSATSPRTSPASPEAAGITCSEAAAGPGTGSTGSGAGPDAYPSSAAAGAAGVGVGSTTSDEVFDIGLGSST